MVWSVLAAYTEFITVLPTDCLQSLWRNVHCWNVSSVNCFYYLCICGIIASALC